MAVFRYQVRDGNGRLVSGDIEAATVNAAAENLLRRGLTPIKISEAKSGNAGLGSIDVSQLWQGKIIETRRQNRGLGTFKNGDATN